MNRPYDLATVDPHEDTAAFRKVNVLQGDTTFSDDPEEVLLAILGSCVGAAMWDPDARVGGLSHFLLPGNSSEAFGNMRFGVYAMELLVNGLIKRGARRENLRVKLFGGAKMYAGSKEIGLANARFAEWFMQSEKFPVISRCLGGQRGRKIRFWPCTGRAQRQFLEEIRSMPAAESRRRAPIATVPETGEIELF